MKTIVSYPERGQGGSNKYRGNCSPLLIEDLLKFFKPKHFLEAFSGSGSGMYAARKLGYTDSVHLDLNPANSTHGSFDLLTMEIPCGADFIFAHPPYFDMVKYSGYMYGDKPLENDISHCSTYEEFIKKLDVINAKLYASLRNGGHYAILIGDIVKKGKTYSIQKDMTWMGDLYRHVIKAQHNCLSFQTKYSGKPFIETVHEHLLIFKKNQVWAVPLAVTKQFIKDLRESLVATWRDLVQAALESFGGKATLSQVYEALENTKKAKQNQNWQAKIRQTLQVYSEFTPIDRGYWGLTKYVKVLKSR